ncbi:hypothetical protein SAMD00019534_099690 [Acytostelium subglobosum LB1]|uniref:hypothetical protein n=1 Tax=Acytostelium subglobosum LB1 TaxID=1410327 RepID=UPI000644CE05|nr:hypothetical protein SAMD00019534_099690 [Acytostelium subglobosum LB1]GAM26794.1 hypothetical protein SAMD00019534_099690 [Acytostelium subglobosum LB1]|eukprot:XP_012750455.1 hypothetical protein SAMD00019534_099690 [Acytostelium subglobosum LB1]
MDTTSISKKSKHGFTTTAEEYYSEEGDQSTLPIAATPSVGRSKKKNTYRFKSFSEQISSIDINIFNKVGDVVIELEEDEEQSDSYFHKTMVAWRELNLTMHFEQFQIELRKCPVTLAEVLLHKEHLVDVITRHMAIAGTMALQPLLGLLTALSRDLRSEFFEHFYAPVLQTMITMLQRPQPTPEVISELFTSLCYLFKFLERQICKDFIRFYDIYSELFRLRKKYLRRFAAESMAFLLRKIQYEQLQQSLTAMFQRAETHYSSNEYCDAFSYLLFQSIKGVKGKFHSRAEHTLPLTFRAVDASRESAVVAAHRILVPFFQLILRHAVNEGDNMDAIWATLIGESDFLAKQLEAKQWPAFISKQYKTFFTIIQSFIKFRRGANIKDYGDVINILGRVLNTKTYKSIIAKQSFDIEAITLTMSSLLPHTYFARFKEQRDAFTTLVDVLFALSDQSSQSNIISFCLSMERHQLFESFIITRLLKYVERNMEKLDWEQVLSFLVRLVALDPTSQDGLHPIREYPTLKSTPQLSAKVKSVLGSADVDNSMLWACLVLAVSLEFQDATILATLEKVFERVSAAHNKAAVGGKTAIDETTYLVGQCLITRVILTSRLAPKTLISLSPVVFALLEKLPNNYHVLNASAIYLETLLEKGSASTTIQKSSSSVAGSKKKASAAAPTASATATATATITPLVSYDQFLKLLPLFSNNLSHQSTSIRRTTVSMLVGLHKATQASSESDVDIQRMLQYMLEIETTQYHTIEGRDVVSKMDALTVLHTSGKTNVLSQHFYNYLLGGYYIRYTPLWTAIQNAIVQVCKSQDKVKVFYPLLYQRLQDVNQQLQEMKCATPMDIDTPGNHAHEYELTGEELNEEDVDTVEDTHEVEDEQDDEEEAQDEEDDDTFHLDLSSLKTTVVYGEVQQLAKGTFNADLGVRNIIRSSTDLSSYNELIWKTYARLGHLIEHYSKEIIVQFLEFIAIDYHRFSAVFARPFDASLGALTDSTRAQLIFAKFEANKLLTYFLEFFAQLKKPAQMHRAPMMAAIFVRTLEIEDSKIQLAGLACMLLSRIELQPYRKNFERLINDKTMREEMVNFVISASSPSCSVPADNRASIVELIIKILLSKLNKKASGNRTTIDAQRTTIFAYLSGLQSAEITPIWQRVSSAFSKFLQMLPVKKGSSSALLTSINQYTPALLDALPQTDSQVNFLNVVHPFIRQMGTLLLGANLDAIMHILLAIAIKSCQSMGNKGYASAKANELRSISFKRISGIIEQFSGVDHNTHLKVLFQVFAQMWPAIQAHGISLGMKQVMLIVSKNPLLVHHLATDPTLLPKLISFVTFQPMQSDVMMLIENLLLGADEHEQYMAVLQPLVTPIITSVKAVLYKKQGASLHSISRRQLVVLAEVSKYARAGDQSAELLELLLPFFTAGSSTVTKLKSDPGLVMSILTIFRNLVEHISDPASHVPALSSLFASFVTRETRELLCQIFTGIGRKVPSIGKIATLLADLNAFKQDTVRLDAYEFEPRLKAFEKLTPLLGQYDQIQLAPILNNMMFYLLDADYSIRGCAANAFSKLIAAMSSYSPEQLDWTCRLLHEIFVPAVKRNLMEPGDARTEMLNLFNKLAAKFPLHFFGDVECLMGDKGFLALYTNIQSSKRRSSFTILRQNIQEHKDTMKAPSITQLILPLCLAAILETSNKETAYLGEIAKAIGEMAAILEWRPYYQMVRTLHRTMAKHPLKGKFMLRALCEVLDKFHFFVNQTDIAPEMVESVKGKKAQISFVPADMEEDTTRELDDDEAAVASAAAASTDPKDAQDDEENKADRLQIQALDIATTKMVVHVAQRVKVRNVSEEIHQAIIYVLVPELEKFLFSSKKRKDPNAPAKPMAIDGKSKSKDKADRDTMVDITVAVAIFKLYNLLPEESTRSLYPPLIGKLANELKSKVVESREMARQTLVKVQGILGVRYFPFMLHDLKFVLKSGYQKHVLVFTLHALLLQLEKDGVQPGEIDKQAPLVMDIIIDYLFLDITIPKDSRFQDSFMEARQPRVLSALKVLVKLITSTSITKVVLQPIEDVLQDSTSPKLVSNVSKMLKKIAKAVLRNKSSTDRDLLILCFNMFKRGTHRRDDVPENKRNPNLKPTYEETFTIQADPRKAKAERVKSLSYNSFVYTDFALQLMFNVMSKSDTEVRPLIPMLDPLVPSLIATLNDKHPKIAFHSIKCLNRLLHLELPSLRPQLASVTVTILKRLQQDAGNEKVSSVCYSTIIQIIKDPANKLLNDAQLKAILILTKQYFTGNDMKQTRAIKMLHVIIERKVMLQEVYELIDLSSNMLIRTQKNFIKKALSDLMIDFLLHYPMGEQRLKQHLTFFIKNMAYEAEEGRLAVLKMLVRIVDQFPQEVLNTYAQLLFVPLIARLANDTSLPCRQEVGNVLLMLLKGVSNQVSKKLIELTLAWFGKGDNVPMSKTAAQVLGLASEAITNFHTFFDQVMPLAIGHLKQGLEQLRRLEQTSQIFEEIGGDDEATKSSSALTGWALYYNIMLMVEKMFPVHAAAMNASDKFVLFWPVAIEYLNYPHVWVRTSVTRLFGQYFNTQKLDGVKDIVQGTSQKKQKQTVQTTIFNPTTLFQITKKTCSLLNSRFLTDDLGLQVTKNLLYLSNVFFKCQSIRPMEDAEEDIQDIAEENGEAIVNGDGDEGEEQDDNVWGFNGDTEMEESSNTNGKTTSSTPTKTKSTETQQQGEEYPMLLWMFKRLSYMASKFGTMRRKYVFRWVGAVANQLPEKSMSQYLSIVLYPLYKSSEAKYNPTKELKDLSMEVLNMIKKKVGAPTFSLAFREIEGAIFKKRALRKQEEKLLAVSDPKEHAIRKAEKRKQRTQSKKRKQTDYTEITDDHLIKMLLQNALSLVLVGIIWGCTNPLIKRGSEGVSAIKKEGALHQFIAEFIYLWTKPSYVIPMLTNLSGSVVFFYTLSQADISLVVPISNSLTFLFTALMGMMLGEKTLGMKSYIGMLFILIGVSICVLSK